MTLAKKIVFSGFFTAGAKMDIVDGKLRIEKEGKVKKLARELEHITFSGRRGTMQGQDCLYVTERCVLKLTAEGLVVTELAPGADLKRDVLEQAEYPLIVSPGLKPMEARYFRP